ncbi:hypothetical protein G7078_08895 [Sphingomonas sinipercae]|uniref:Uncharacterized protein n=1 Tax=Sphingomonas sinipercae TaxID=2714944 RepID=A0A6G7ZPR2_9SPHN|nr:tetratricopeptide repeat protein [Sphingomonas sinipercae]QIL02890.1 hypothetical protein G7078_08895 [Sphingomonas sinipercae]
MLRLFASIVLLACASGAQAAWLEAKTPHFLIYSEQSPRQLQDYATRLEKFDRAVRILRNMSDPPVGQSGRVTIYMLNDTDAVSRLATGKITSIAGFYIPRASGSVAFVPRDAGSGRETDLTADAVFFHEYAHHMLLQNSEAPFPPWFVEGFAEFFSQAAFPKDGGVQLGMPANHRSFALFALDKAKLTDLLGATFVEKTGEDTEKFYSRSWLLTHYLAFSDARQGQLTTYVRGIEQGLEPIAAARAAFGDLAQLDRELDLYLRKNKLQYRKVNGPQLNVPAAAIRSLRPGEAAVMKARIMSTRGVDKKAAQEVLALARSAAAPYPADPGAQVVLAEAEFDAGNYREASAAADRALAADPNSIKALLYKGRAEMELASTGADWTRIRNWFVKANKLDPEAAEPLVLFYESYFQAGERPTDNAIEGLLYAQVLGPQDAGLRLNAAYALIQKKKFDEARKLLAPLANSPHRGGGREQARKMIAKLAAGDQKGALDASEEGDE